MTSEDFTLEMLEKSWAGKLTRSNLGKRCIVCGDVYHVEMHHVRKIRELLRKKKHLDWYHQQMAAINRQQVPLCHKHHVRVHNDSLTPLEKQMFNEGCKALVEPYEWYKTPPRPHRR
jgi:hypothetical protein